MPVFLNTLGNSTLGIGICDRCKFKRPLGKLGPDGNTPGLMVCQDKSGCKDEYDPWRLPAIQDDRINLPFVRPDEDIAVSQTIVSSSSGGSGSFDSNSFSTNSFDPTAFDL